MESCVERFQTHLARPDSACLLGAVKTKPAEALPIRATLDGIEAFRADFRATLDAHARRIDGQLDEVRGKLDKFASRKKVPASLGRDLRDMLTLLRHHGAKPARGRPKDLKKFHAVANDLTMLADDW